MHIRTGRPTTLAFDGMVATPHSLASAAGLAALRDGGSAIDAVIAANAVLTVIYPDQTSIGGDCFLTYFDASTGALVGLNGSGRAPKLVDRERLRATYGSMPARGVDAVTVPGTIDAWTVAGERFGRLGLERLLQPAIGYARNGFPVTQNLHEGIAGVTGERGWTADLALIYFPDGVAPAPGSRMRLPDLANSLEAIARGGREVFYTGAIAEQIVATSARLGGSLNADDLASHHAEWVQPLTTTYRGLTVAEMPPNSQGVAALIELNLAELVQPAAWGSADHLHPLIEAKKMAFAIRDQQVSDPAFVPFDAERIVSKQFAQELWRGYDPANALAGMAVAAGDTVYLCAVDRDGNAASMIQSIYRSFGSGVVAGGTGIVLQCRGAYFSLEDDAPNRIEGGKRTLHTLMPGMLLRDGTLVGPIGTQGGDAQAQVHLQLITNLVDHGMSPQEAIEMPRWIAGGADPRQVTLETGFDNALASDLAARGHQVVQTGSWDIHFGHAQMILRDEESGLLRGGADPRADGTAIGY